MKTVILCVILSIPVILLAFHLLTRKYVNPFRLIFVFGKKGSGKSTFLAKKAIFYLKRGWIVYSNLEIPGTIPFSIDEFGKIAFPKNSCVIIDEAGMIWDNRKYKNLSDAHRDYFKLQRHYGNVLILASQTFDVDKKIRDLADEMYLITKFARVFTYSRRILKKIVLNNSTAEAPSKIDEDLMFDSILLFWAGSRGLTFIPKYAGLFDSFETPDLPPAEGEPTPLDWTNPVITKRYRFMKKRNRRSRSRSTPLSRLTNSILWRIRFH